jgi:hypothetical protein
MFSDNDKRASVLLSQDDKLVARLCANVHVDSVVDNPDGEMRDFIQERLNKKCPDMEKRQLLLEQEHVLGHFGAEVLYKKLWTSGYYWPGMRKDCSNYVAKCVPCLRFNVGKRGFNPMVPIHAEMPWDHIAMDLFSLSTTTPRGNNYGLVIVDICTRYVVLEALPDKLSSTVSWCLWRIFSVFGVPKIIQSDNGAEFVNSVMDSMFKLMGIDHRLIAAYNPRANGAAERFVGSVQKCVLKAAGGNVVNWDLYLPGVQLALNTKPSSSTNSAPHALMFGRGCNPFSDFSKSKSKLMSESEVISSHEEVMKVVIPDIMKSFKQKQADTAASVNSKRSRGQTIPVGATVMVKDVHKTRKTEPHWLGPYQVVEVTKAKTYRLLDTSGVLLNRSVPLDQLKLVSLPAKEKINGQKFGGQSYAVEKVLDHRGPEGEREYLVKWLGYSSDENTWETESHFDDLEIIRRYWSDRK